MTYQLSVVIPIYNSEKYLKTCLDSIVKQIDGNTEIVLVDDGSKDNSTYICDQFADSNNSIKVIHSRKNEGPINARKKGILASKGKYITFVDSDDYLCDNYFHTLCSYIKEYGADIITEDILVLNNSKIHTIRQQFNKGFYNKQQLEDIIYPFMIVHPKNNSFGILPSLCTKCIRREILITSMKCIDNNITLGDDAAFSYTCLLNAQSLLVLDEAFYVYRQNSTSLTHSYDCELIQRIGCLCDYFSKLFEEYKLDVNQLYKYVLLLNHAVIDNEVYYCHDSVIKRIYHLSKYKKQPVVQAAIRYAMKNKDCSKMAKIESFAFLYNFFCIFWIKKALGRINKCGKNKW